MAGKRSARDDSSTPRQSSIKRGGQPDDPCDFDFEIDLSGIQVGPLSTLSVGTVLDVGIVGVGDFESVACLRPKERDVVGTLAAFEGLTDLIGCIRRGNRYSARVTILDRGACRVRVRRAS